MSPLHAARTAVRVLRGEGLRGAVDRARDRLDEWRDARVAAVVSDGALGRADVLNVLGMPAAARLGGVPLQLRERLRQEAAARPVALLSREDGRFRLERSEGPERRVLVWSAPPAAPAALDDPAAAAAIARALEETGARLVHFEGLAGTAPRAALAVPAATRVVLTVHDHTPHCPRPHLWEATAARFCGFSTDEDRCLACLARDFERPHGFPAAWRAAAADLLARADALVFPSVEMREVWRSRLPALDASRQHVIEPGAPPAAVDPRPPGGVVRHAAFVGAATEAKGARLVPAVARAVADVLRVSAFGGGHLDVLRALRAEPGVEVRGYYRAGTLPRLLREQAVDVALLLSLVPESYGLTLDECWRAGVPVIAFDHGAVAGRIRRHGGGVLVPLAEGAAGVAAALRALVGGSRPLPAVPALAALATPASAAGAHAALYRGLLQSPP